MMNWTLTGTPGSGKTTLLRALELRGHGVVEEAATDVIAERQAMGVAEPWMTPDFIERIMALQIARAEASPAARFHDRSVVCTHALCTWLGFPVPAALQAAVGGMARGPVLFVRNLGFVEPTAARRISFEDALAFEALHERTYREFGFELVEVPAMPLGERVALVERIALGR